MTEQPESPIRIGVVGSGLMGEMHSAGYRHAQLLPSAHRPFALQRVASRNKDTSAALAARFDWASSTTDWREVTRAEDVDLVDVCTPEDTHAEVALDALAHGKHVLCEKPLAVSGAEAREMWRAAQASGRVHMAGFVVRHWPALRTARALLDEGRLGPVRGVRAQYLLDSRTLLESALRGLGSHLLDAAMYLAGPISSVCALSRPVEEHPATDAAVAALLRFESGCAGVLQADREASGRPMDLSLAVDCAEGSVEIAWSRREQIELVLDAPDALFAGPRRIVTMPAQTLPTVPFPGAGFGVTDLFAVQAQALAAAISGVEASYADFGDGFRVAVVSDAIRDAWAGDGWVTVTQGQGDR